jgi:DNA-binding beta-propeller fold protein YncE
MTRKSQGGIAVCALGALLASGCALFPAGSQTSGTPVAATIPFASVHLDGSPGVPAVNSQTDTLYVPIECPTAACATGSNLVDVINTRRCNAVIASGCRVVAREVVGVGPQAVAVDEATDTVYVPDAGGETSVFNGARCNAKVTSGCGMSEATVNVGGVAAVVNPATRTLYVADPGGGIHVIDAATCNAMTPALCRDWVSTVTDDDGPLAVDVDIATDTVYAVNDGWGKPSTVSVIDGSTCNGRNGSGCGLAPRTVTVGNGASWDAVDQASDTVYVANQNDGTVSVINGSQCDSSVTTDCTSTPLPGPSRPRVSVVDTAGPGRSPEARAVLDDARTTPNKCLPSRTSGCVTRAVAVPSGAGAAGVAVDDSLHTVFAVNQDDDTLSALNTSFCDGATISACRDHTVRESAGLDQEAGFNGFPNSITLVPQTDTAYLVSTRGSDVLAVVNVAHCHATDRSTCRLDAPSLSDPGFEATVDAATDTIYASNNSLPDIDVFNGATCDATRRSGCASLAEIPMPDSAAAMGAIDDTTDTLYASDSYGTEVAVINIATCNATDISGCADRPRTIDVGAEPGSPVLNPATDTLYLPFGTSADRIAVINAATCNAEVGTGCGQRPADIDVGEGTFALGVSATTDTIYAPSGGITGPSADTVAIISGVACNGTDHSGCGHVAATVQVGPDPYGVAVSDATDTVYVANDADGEVPGTLSMINESTCNGSSTAGCGGTMTTIGIGRGPHLVVVDGSADFVYVSDHASAEVSELNGATCNAENTSGCNAAIEQPVGSQPFGMAVNPDTNTVYAMTFLGVASISVFAGGA